MLAYSLDLRKRILADCDHGDATKVVATRYRVSTAWVRRLKQRRRESGEITPRKPKRIRGGKLAAHHEQIKLLNQQKPDRTLTELRDALGLDVSIWTVWRTLRELKISFKKKRFTHPNRTARMSRPNGSNGAPGRSVSTRAVSSSSTKRGRRPT